MCCGDTTFSLLGSIRAHDGAMQGEAKEKDLRQDIEALSKSFLQCDQARHPTSTDNHPLRDVFSQYSASDDLNATLSIVSSARYHPPSLV